MEVLVHAVAFEDQDLGDPITPLQLLIVGFTQYLRHLEALAKNLLQMLLKVEVYIIISVLRYGHLNTSFGMPDNNGLIFTFLQ